MATWKSNYRFLCFFEDILDKVEDGQSVADWTENRVTVRCEDEISLLVDSSTKVRELRKVDRGEIVENVIPAGFFVV